MTITTNILSATLSILWIIIYIYIYIYIYREREREYHLLVNIDQLAGGVEYTDCTSAEG